ncbi:cytosolic sulfotransferase 5-like [Eucalyptus grandis]|uniref:cytosolic sulfotransferase 5-like n=1 Tax=Eucalyptus grandis TaxID=71139 RepID=UPI00192E9E4E|nr:cytosolic sulfotransferase 5-like [Eucalyptus grandis]
MEVTRRYKTLAVATVDVDVAKTITMGYSAPTEGEASISLDQLPQQLFWETLELYWWNGFWYRPRHLEAALALRSQFRPRDDDVLLASAMKTGSTWLKALCFCILTSKRNERSRENGNIAVSTDREDQSEDPLAANHPAHYVKTLEVQVFTENPPPDLSVIESPRLFHTHLPYSALPESVKASPCKIVYLTRNPKDTLVSLWHFFNHFRTDEEGPFPFERAFESFCDGVCSFGPFFEHVLEYYRASLAMPEKVLFLKYEDLKRDPRGQVKRLSSFLGRQLEEEEEEVEDIVWRCSLERLKNLEVNRNGVDPWVNMPNSVFFRKGVVGDWKSLFTAEMARRLDEIARTKLEGSGLDLGIDT